VPTWIDLRLLSQRTRSIIPAPLPDFNTGARTGENRETGQDSEKPDFAATGPASRMGLASLVRHRRNRESAAPAAMPARASIVLNAAIRKVPTAIPGESPALHSWRRTVPGGKPHHIRTMARAVPIPAPAGSPASHHRSRRASETANCSASRGESSNAWPTRQVCSVSSITIPRPKISRWRSGPSPKTRVARRRDKPSRGNPSASPTAVPRMTPAIRSQRSIEVALDVMAILSENCRTVYTAGPSYWQH
jgi:hypothetical protein